jgi:hypothetical protein
LPRKDYSRPEILPPKIASASLFTPPTGFTTEHSPETKVMMSDTSRALGGLEDNVRHLTTASASQLTNRVKVFNL